MNLDYILLFESSFLYKDLFFKYDTATEVF